LLAHPLIQLHGPRDWKSLPTSLTSEETRIITAFIELIKSREPAGARKEMRALLDLPPEAVKAQKKTAVGTLTTIEWEGE
jgi:hypothetical protein